MKKLSKLSFNLNKVMKNEELVNLRGGYGYTLTLHQCTCTTYNPPYNTNGICGVYTAEEMSDWLYKACADSGSCKSVTNC